MKTFVTTTFARAGGWLAGARRVRAAMMLLLTAMFLMPQTATAKDSRQDYESGYEGRDFGLNNNGNYGQYILFRVTYWNDYGTDEGWCHSDGLKVYASKDGGSNWEHIGTIKVNSSGGRSYSGSIYEAWTESTSDTKITIPRWNLPRQYHNCNIKIKCEGYWCDYDGGNCNWKSTTWSCTSSYAFSVRSISWNGNIGISADGTVTVPYTFGGANNTDGETHICTRINGGYNGSIGYKYPASNYAAGSYTFNLSTIGKDMRSEFTIEPYHEFTHNNDKDASNGVRYYCTYAGSKTFLKMPLATLSNPVFSQLNRSVTLNWSADNTNYGNGKWIIYRNGTKVAAVSQGTYTYTDKGFPDESNVKYYIYYVGNGWAESAQRSELKSNEVSVNTTRTVPLNNPGVVSKDDRLVFTWSSDGYPAGWGNKFKIYIDNELACTYTPKANQTSFQWEHRTTDQHNDRKSFVDESTGVPYTEEPLSACSPHTYRIEGVIGDKVFTTKTFESQSIGKGTLFYSLDATKGAYPGTVKLTWHVNQQGNTAAKTYIVERRRAEKDNEPWVTLYRTSSNEDYLMYTDDTPLPGVFYEYQVTVEDKCDNGMIIPNTTADIGFAQTTGTVSGRVTFGSTGSSVANVDVEAKRTGASDDDAEQYHAMSFTGDNGAVTWTYPSATYAADKLASGDFTVQMWVNPETLAEAKMVRLNGMTCYIGMNAEGKLTLDRGKTFTSYTPIAGSGGYSGQNYSRMIDNNPGTKWCCEFVSSGLSAEFSTPDAIIPSGYVLTTGDDTKKLPNRNPTDWKLYGRLNEGDAWTLLDSIGNYTSLPADNLVDVYFNFSNSQPYKYFRFEVKGVSGIEGNTYKFQLQELKLRGSDQVYTFDNAALKAKQYNHVVLTRSGSTVTASVVGTDADGVAMLKSSTQNIDGDWTVTGATQLTLGNFVGYVDEFRLWTKALTEAEILENYDHLLVGNEKQLETYWTFDEGLSRQFFDYSRDGTVYHQHHGKMGDNVQSSNQTPAQLKLKAKTDRDGNYIIQGVPFSGEGTTYAVIPSLGIHKFNPTQQLRFVGNNSLVHNGTDFTDVSSFPVRGTIRYANTDYPVEGVQFYVDGQICAKGGEPVTTNAYGQYEISVPIGKHYITVAKQGHEFADGGRYPADPEKVDTLVNFNDAVNHLDFEDVTLVTVAGRVTGGKIEEEKPLGFGQSVNNIGQATITLGIDGFHLNVLRHVDGITVSYDNNPDDLEVSSPTADVKSTAYRQGGDADQVKKVIIKTDPATGEFAALLPPIDYRVESIEIESNQQLTFDNLPNIFASDPTQTETDSLALEDGTVKEFEYVAKLIQSYYTEPQLEVTQKGRSDGSFGEETYIYTDPKTQEETELTLYTSEGGTVTYNYDFPIFQQMKQYTFNVRGFETYVNYDGESPVTYEVPLQNVPVTFSNQMGTGQGVVIDATKTEGDDADGDLAGDAEPDQLTLDDEGRGLYVWQAGFPNITSPYTRTLAATFTHNDKGYTWTGVNTVNSLSGIVIGALPTGNNFVTNGPDKVEMIIRDPAGTGSSAFWETGQSVAQTETQTITVNNETEMMTHTEIGFELTSLTAAGTGIGIILGVIETNKSKVDLDVGVTTEYEHVSADTKVLTTTNTKRISTSSEPEYVGAQGDVFIGQSTNIVFGNARSVGFKKNATSGDIELKKFDNYVTGQEFATHFQYTQNYIEHVLIPNLTALRNSILSTGVDEQGLIYNTTLAEGDPNFGAAGTYTTVKPATNPKELYTDMVQYYNQQIANWESQLAWNELMKVMVISDRRTWLDSNQSFDSGTFIDAEVSSEITSGQTTSNTFNTSIIAGGGTSVSIFGQDVDISVKNTTKAGSQWESSTETTQTVTTGYSLVETGDDDALTVDVYRAPDCMGAIFVTRGGQTTCPYEGEQKTKYFEPGKHTIAAATMQIEVPKIAVENAANNAVGVPAGKKASYNLLLTNESETDEDCYFSLFPIDETNTEGAKLTVNGDHLGNGRRVLVPAGRTVRMNLELAQNNTGGLLYEGIAIVLASECQSDPASTWDVIGDTVVISAEFVPTSTDVALRIDNRVVNTSTKGMLPLTVTGYDPNYEGLKYIAVQYQGVGETAWHDARKYVMNEQAIVNQIDEVLPTSGIINLNYDMTNGAMFPDRTYKFRAISARTYGNGEVTNVSDEILVVKDMSRPKPLGQPQPTDGILTAGDELSILFNETILNGELTKDANFRVTGVLNGSKVEHQTALRVGSGSVAAATEASINLANKDFSIDMWVKANGAGTLLSHGTGTQKLTVGVDADSKMVVKIGDQTYTSNNIVPLNEWAFLTLSMTQDGKLSASVATDATTTTLFSDKEAVAYEGNGPLAVGQEMTGAMHELLLWDEARDVATALQQRSVTKTPSTQGLIGYWKMNEGEGTSIRDYARNRHMTMAAETWHIENDNKAVTLDGSHYVGINTSEIPPMPQDDYAVELWVKAGEQTADAQLLQLGEVGLVLKSDGSLALESDDSPLSTVNSQLNDNVWHHVALSVLRGGNANVYVDGAAKATVSADKVGSLGSDQLLIGARRTVQDVQQNNVLYQYDRALTATIDEVRVWNATMSGDQLKNQRKVRLTGTEPGLVAYYPFEVKTLNAQNQVITNGSAADLCNSSHKAQLCVLGGSAAEVSAFTDEAPALRVKPEEENVSFTFTASDNKIVINIDEAPAKIEGTTLNFTVRDVHDQNGNLSEPVSWSAFVSLNPLSWKENAVSCTSKMTDGATLTATLVNKSGQQQVWTMSDLPSWLEADMTYGDLKPLGEQTITFTVSESTPIGKYEQTVYVAGNNGIETPLTLNIKVTGNVPDWAVNSSNYELSMNIIGSVDILGTPCDDADDIVAAFVGDECRGLAQPEYNVYYDAYFVTMDIYGDGNEGEGNPLTFKIYDASTGITYPVVTTTLPEHDSPSAIVFEADNLLGRYHSPVLIKATDEVEQTIDLNNGWNWMSLNVECGDMTVPVVFARAGSKVNEVKNHTDGFTMYNNGEWKGSLTQMSSSKMYAVQTNEAFTLSVTGHRVVTSDAPITVKSYWNWVGYNAQSLMSVTDALAGMDPQEGDIIKAQQGVAYYSSMRWNGSLKTLMPGKGYKIYSAATADRTFFYPNKTATGANARMVQPLTSHLFTPVDYSLYPANMVLIAQVVSGDVPVEGVELGVFAGEECREAAVTDENGMVYITIPGDKSCELTFRTAYADASSVYSVPSVSVTYETDAVIGKPSAPFVIDLASTTGISEMENGELNIDNAYDLQGRRVNVNDNVKVKKGIYIINGQKKVK